MCYAVSLVQDQQDEAGQREADAGGARERDQDCLWEWCHRVVDKQAAAHLIVRHLGAHSLALCDDLLLQHASACSDDSDPCLRQD